MRGGVHHPLILLLFTPEKDKDPPLMALLGAMGPYIIIRSLAQRMRFKKEWLLDFEPFDQFNQSLLNNVFK